MITQEIVNNVEAELRLRSEASGVEIPVEDVVYPVLATLEVLGYRVIPSTVEVMSSNIREFEEIVTRWNSNVEMSVDDVNGYSILDSLQGQGWLIIPPL